MGTLYDPERAVLHAGAISLLKHLSKTADLYLVTRLSEHYKSMLKEFGVEHLFAGVSLVERKTKKVFEEMIRNTGREYDEVFCVGDVIWDEIIIGNKLGWKTIWFKNGKFGNVVPKDEVEIPWKTVESLEEIAALFEA